MRLPRVLYDLDNFIRTANRDNVNIALSIFNHDLSVYLLLVDCKLINLFILIYFYNNSFLLQIVS